MIPGLCSSETERTANRWKHAAANLPNVRFLPFRPVEQVPHVMMAGDVHIVTVKRGLEGVVVPSKLYSILAAGRPVLAVAPKESDAARIVTEEAAAAWRPIRTIRPRWPRRFGNLRSDPARLVEMGRRAREAASRYARVGELQHFVEIMEHSL